MKLLTILSLVVLLCCSCQKENKEETDSEIENKPAKSQPLDLSTRIGNAYNVTKFQSETALKYSAEVSLADTVYFKGIIRYNISEQSLNVKTGQKELSISSYPEHSQMEQFLFQLNEIYTLPFYLDKKAFETLDKNDSIITSKFDSNRSKMAYTIQTHPLTEIIQSIQTENAESVLDNSTIVFDNYITVNRIPVSMLWEIYKNEKRVGAVRISRISYPAL